MAVSKPNTTEKTELCRICKERPVTASALRRHHHECPWCENCSEKARAARRVRDARYRLKHGEAYKEHRRFYMRSYRHQLRIEENRI
jgi:hypothetical protein